MARTTQTAEEQQILSLLQQIKSNGKSGKDINKALGLFKKSQRFLEEAIAVLEGDSTDNVVDPEAPYGRKADGTPKQKGGRKKGASVLDNTGAAENTTTDEAAADGAATSSSKKRK